MRFKDFKQATQRFNVLKKSDIAGSFHFPTATVSFESLARRDIEALSDAREVWQSGKRLTEAQYEVLSRTLPLAAHEYTHFIDGTSTVWGLKFLTRMSSAYACSDVLQKDETTFWHAKTFHDWLTSIALPQYYTVKTEAQNTRPWKATVTAGQVFDKNGRVTDRAMLFQHFLNAQDETLVRSPISSVSILESSAMAQETALRVSLVRRIEGDFAIVERSELSRRSADYLYNPNLTEYSVCIHRVANALRTPDIVSAFLVCSVLTRVCLNLTDEAFEALAADQALMSRVKLPDEHEFSDRMRGGLRHRDLGTAFFLMTQCLPSKPDLQASEAESVARAAVEALGIDTASLHAKAIAAAEQMELDLRSSVIEPIRLLAQCGLENLRTLDPWSARIDFSRQHLPKALLGDSSEVNIVGDMASPLAQRPVDSIFEPLYDGELWVERFAEGCL